MAKGGQNSVITGGQFSVDIPKCRRSTAGRGFLYPFSALFFRYPEPLLIINAAKAIRTHNADGPFPSLVRFRQYCSSNSCQGNIPANRTQRLLASNWPPNGKWNAKNLGGAFHCVRT